MNEKFVQRQFAERIGGDRFGTDDTVYKFEKIKRAKRAALAQFPEVEIIDMGVGEPDDMAFPEVVETLIDEAGKWENRTYTDNGIPEFRASVCRYMLELFGVTLDADRQVCHAIGSKSALTLIPSCFINPGDISIMTTPGYPVLGTWTRYFGGEVINLPLTKESNFLPELDSLTSEQRTRTKLLYLNYPNNPTGAAATRGFFEKAVEFALENEIIIVSDAAYAALNFNGDPLSILSIPGAMDCAIELHSMSKGFNMTGWRLAWACGNALIVNAFAYNKDNADSGQFAAIQKASAKALDSHGMITPKICEKYERRLNALVTILREIGFDASMPGGSFFLYVEIPKGTSDGTTFASAEDFSQWLIRERQISAVPWDDAGQFIRFSATFNAPSLEEENRVMTELRQRLTRSTFNF